MKILRNIGGALIAVGVLVFTSSMFMVSFDLRQDQFDSFIEGKGFASESFATLVNERVVGNHYNTAFSFSSAVESCLTEANEAHMTAEEWGQVIWDSPKEMAFSLEKVSATGPLADNKDVFLFFSLILGIIGGLMHILAGIQLEGPAGIKNDHVYHQKATNRGWIAYVVFFWLISFYVFLYFFPNLIVGWVMLVDPIHGLYATGGASQWFLYGLLYCIVMLVMGIRMIIKYRHNNYQIVRTISVVFFQVVFAFLLVEILPLFNLPAVDLKSAWPLDYDFLYDWNIKKLFQTESYGKFGVFVFVWGIILALVLVPIFVYIYGKRWYCSWVCGCGGLAETLGDPYRQHSSKSLFSWKIERWLIHSVLIFAVIMTTWVGMHTYSELHVAPGEDPRSVFLGLSAFDVRGLYGFLIGSIFSGIVGTGFYPIFGNRMWCRFGCPLAAYMGFIQRFKSRFRITTNGSQCISCGNCSTYCEQGIDVRWYAQRGQNIVRSSCVGCGVCSAVCPRGVLKLENGPEEARIQSNPIIIGNDGVSLNQDL